MRMNDVAATNATGSAEAEIIRRFLATLRKTQFLPADALVAYQRGLLEKLVRHARAQVPFYRDSGRLDCLFRRDGSIDWARWSEVMPVTRTEVQNDRDRMICQELGPEHGRTWTRSTSGSTGEPVTIVHTELSGGVAWSAVLLRDFERHRIDPTRRLVQLSPFTPDDFDISGPRRHAVWFEALDRLGIAGERVDLADTRPAGDLVEAVVDAHPDYLHLQPTTLELMLAHDREKKLSRLGVEAIITYGEHLAAATRRAAERHLDCRLVDLYGSNECGFIASSCPHCGNYHVHAETVLVEVVNDDGGTCAAGDVGRIIVTPLYNYAMPLIRYEHADEGRPTIGGTCPVRLPALSEVSGKKRQAFVFPGGRAIRPTLPIEGLIEHLGARMFQVAQVAPDRCEVRIVPGTLDPARMQFDRMTAMLRGLWWQGLQIDYRLVERIPRRSPREKLQQFIVEMAEPRGDDRAGEEGGEIKTPP